MTARHEIHAAAVRYVAAWLAAPGVPVKTATEGGLDLATPGHTIAVRVCRLGTIRRTIRGKQYEYPGVRWNLHQHGVRQTNPDVWVLVVADGPEWPCYVVPGHLLERKLTVEITLGAESHRGRPRNGVVRPYLNAWDALRRRRRAAA